MLRYTLRDLVRNPRRSLASVLGVALAVGLFSGIVFFVDSSAASMTQRAIAPVTIDMQAGLSQPLASALSLTETIDAAGALATGQVATITLAVTNNAGQPATGVVVTDQPPAPLVYIPASTRLDGVAIPAGDQPNPLADGLLLGPVPAHGTRTVTYQARASAPVAGPHALAWRGTALSQQDPVPAAANAAAALTWPELQARVAAVRGVRTAELLASADLPAASLASGQRKLSEPLRLLAFDPVYLNNHPMVRLSGGQYSAGLALVSPATAVALGIQPGSSLSLFLPGRPQPLQMTAGGIADFSAANALFTSRNPETEGEFAQVPNVLVVSPDLFLSQVLPALRADAATASPVLKSPPYLEVDVGIDRARLVTDPALALTTTQGLKRTLERLAPGQVRVTDNLSRALSSARSDVVLAKALFLFLGLPGVLLAGYLSRYAGSLLAQAQRRERATLRARGVQSGHLLRVLTYNTIAVSLVGSLLGLGLGAAALLGIFGSNSIAAAPAQSLALSAGLSLAAGLLTTALAIYLPGRRSLARETGEERREMEAPAARPAWLRIRLDLILLAAAAIVAGITYLAGGFKPTGSEGQAVSLSFYALLTPLLAWLGGTLLGARLALGMVARLPDRRHGRFGRLVGGTLSRSVRRRSPALGAGVIAVSLAVAFGTSLAIFAASYEAEQQLGARFVVGSDMRVTPSALSRQPGTFSRQLQVPGVSGVSPVAETQNALVGTDKKNLVAVDAGNLASVADMRDSFFNGTTAERAMSALRADPAAVLVATEMASTFNIQPGDQVKVQLRDAAGNTVPVTLHTAGLFFNFPGFPQGVDLVGNLAYYQSATGIQSADFFLLRTTASDPASLTRVAEAIRTGPGRAVPLQVQTTTTAFNLDQSSLASLNLRGLGSLESAYTVLMSAGAVAVFVFGLLLQRRKEFVTMSALGIRMAQLRALVLGEAGLVAVISLAIGAVVGTAMAVMFVRILSPLFTVGAGAMAFPAGRLSLLGGAVLLAMLLAAWLAAASLSRLNPVELLREE
jgi:putative ABC transport system permease protein